MAAILAWLRNFWKATNPGPSDLILWHCRPLPICDGDDRPVFTSQEIDVEYTPDGRTPQGGVARIVNSDEPAPVPELAVIEMEIRGVQGRFGTGREGVILRGSFRGEPFTWYTDGRADEFADAARREPPADRTRRAGTPP